MSVYVFTGLVPETNPIWRQSQLTLPVAAAADRVEETLFAEPPSWMPVENQGQTNMCAAHAGTSCAEKIQFMKTGKFEQLSRNYLYAEAQKRCGLYGDQGVTLGSIIAALTAKGDCPEEMYPFKGTFNSKVPPGCDEEAAKRKLTKTLDVEQHGYAGFREVIGQNIGSVLMACSWPIRLWEGYIVEEYQPQGRGGHALAALFLSTRKDSQGRPYVWDFNSHDVTAQRRGCLLWSPQALDSLIQSQEWGATGLTDMLTPKPRKVEWSGQDNPFAK
jgi:hypothetical protein